MTQIRQMTKEECKQKEETIKELYSFFKEVVEHYVHVNNNVNPFSWDNGELTNRFETERRILVDNLCKLKDMIGRWQTVEDSEEWKVMNEKILGIIDGRLYSVR